MAGKLLEDSWLDITRMVEVGMPLWPGDPQVELARVSDMSRGDECNVSRLTICTHTGTHMDAPLHYLADGQGIEAAPLAALMGAARVIAIDDPVCIRQAALECENIQAGSRILFKTANSQRPWGEPFCKDYVYIAADAARYLAELKLLLVGIDGMSVGGFEHDMVETHVTLLGAGVWVVENLKLENVSPGNYEIVCLPMKIAGADGAPARVLLRKA